MADDLDAELLALAGDASDEETSPPPNQHAGSPTSPTSPRSPVPSSGMPRKSTAKTVRRGRKEKRADEEVEDGELSSVESQQSLPSASMSESESELEASPPPGEDDGPIFPFEKLYYSAQDKEEIIAMPEIQREQMLSERAQQVDRHNQDLALRRLLASREREEARKAKKNKRKASLAGLEEGHRKSSRQKTTLGGRKVGEASDAIEAYKRQREQKNKRDEIRRRDAAAKDTKASLKNGDVSDADVDGESEAVIEWGEKAEPAPAPPEDDPPAELQDIQRARVGRSNFALVCFYPGFDDAISGCYARVNIGPNRETGQNEYRLCLIKRFTDGRPYAMEGSNGRAFVTNQYAVLAHGKAERDFPFIACSDSPITDAEFYRYCQTLTVEDCKIPTKSMLAQKVEDINGLLNHQFTKEELNEKLRKQGSLDIKMQTFKRLDIEKNLKAARAAGDEAEIQRLEAELMQITGPKLAFGTSLFKPQTQKQTEYERLAEINLRNQKLNYESVRRAQLEEKKARKAAAAARGEGFGNPFMRVKTRAKTYYDVNGMNVVPTPDSQTPFSGRSQNGTPVPDASAKQNPHKRGDTPTSSQKKSSKGISVIRHRNTDDECIAALDLDLDVDI